MGKALTLCFLALLSMVLTACVERPENEMVQETEQVDPASGIDLTTQINGTFKGFSENGRKAATIEVDGADWTYRLADDAAGDFESLEKGDAVAFSLKEVDGQEMIENLWEK